MKFSRRILRVKWGFKSLRKNPFKLIIALAYITGVVMLWLNKEHLIQYLPLSDWVVLSIAYQRVFKIVIPLFGIYIFLLMMSLFGTVIYWASKVENAFISAGVYTKAGKTPYLIARYKDKETGVYTIWELYLNGNTKADFEIKKENLNSELGIVIKSFEKKGEQILLINSVSDKANQKINRNDKNFGG